MMAKNLIQFDLYSLLMELSTNECELIGIRLIKEVDSYFIGISWLTKGELYFRCFNKLTLLLLTKLYLPKIISIRPQWQSKLNHWARKTPKIISLGKLAYPLKTTTQTR